MSVGWEKYSEKGGGSGRERDNGQGPLVAVTSFRDGRFSCEHYSH